MTNAKALVRSGVQYADGRGPASAPPGEYAVETEDGQVRFARAGERAFTLSFDSFSRHVMEGRIALIAA